MIGLKRRKKAEGWTLKVSEAGDERRSASLLQRLGDNNKLWTICVVGVLLLTAFFVYQGRPVDTPPQEYAGEPGYHGIGTYDDEAHTALAESLGTNKSYESVVESARFVNQERLEMIAKDGVNLDEVDYAARMAARIILEKFRQRVVVEVFAHEPSGKRLIARTKWSPDKLGYVVKFNSNQSEDQ